ncbi:MAE_28990/MAE_18760 family HEPN-like nuclease, partial [Fluviicola sp.]|uniref:MAE_28990/MAE_18760 family HEPN-like nuclease n=1 Tax=Fluviicola sp. TaxID=1917219 RepID=UPI002620CDAF
STFLALSLQSKLGDLTNGTFENRVKIIDFLFSDLSKQSNIPKKNIINTKSNLRFEVLIEILFILDLDDAHIHSQESLINDLVDTRNHIAHGEYKLVNYNIFESLLNDTVALMEYLKTAIENNAIQEKYKKSISV